MHSVKLKKFGYWPATGLVSVAFVFGGLVDAAHPPSAVALLAHLGYPAYFAILLGVWKVLGGITILAPRFPRLKEWAYAGMVFDLTGAAVSHAASGDGAPKVIVPLILTAIVFASWGLRPQSRMLGVAAPDAMERTDRAIGTTATA
jgi:uncharacterized membrane protein YphA (DoxX/SURF4 family)